MQFASLLLVVKSIRVILCFRYAQVKVPHHSIYNIQKTVIIDFHYGMLVAIGG